MYVIAVDFETSEEHLEAFITAVKAQAKTSLDVEPGCLRFDVCQDPDRPERIFLYEIYESPAAFDIHLASAHMAAFNETVADWTVSKVVKNYTLLDTDP